MGVEASNYERVRVGLVTDDPCFIGAFFEREGINYLMFPVIESEDKYRIVTGGYLSKQLTQYLKSEDVVSKIDAYKEFRFWDSDELQKFIDESFKNN